MKTPRVIGIIPARYESVRFPGKMLANIAGTSLIQRTYTNAKKSSICDALLVATDDQRIFDHVKGFGGQVVMTAEAPTGTDRAAEAIEKYYPDSEIVVVIQGDEPLLNPVVINTLVQDLQNHPSCHMTTPVEEISSFEEIMKSSVVKCVFNDQRKALYFSRLPIPYVHHPKNVKTTYYRHIGLYCFRKEFLLQYRLLPKTKLQMSEDLEQLKVLEHGFSIYVSLVSPQGCLGVDYPEDIKKVEAFLCQENTSL